LQAQVHVGQPRSSQPQSAAHGFWVKSSSSSFDTNVSCLKINMNID
jgi:hypothetical protein